MENIKCIERDNHRWGVCLQSCIKCQSEDTITVNWCVTEEQYVCYSCKRKGA